MVILTPNQINRCREARNNRWDAMEKIKEVEECYDNIAEECKKINNRKKGNK